MVDTRPTSLNRKLLGEFLKNPETIKAFENLSLNSDDLAEVITGIQSAAVLVLNLSDLFENERVISSDGEVQLTDGGPGGNLTFGLSDTGVTADSYGDASHLVRVAINAKGRVTLAQTYALNSDNVTEGAANLYYTDVRARLALTSGTGMAYDSATGAIAVGAKLAAYDGGDTPSAFTLSIVDSADAAAWRTAIGAGTGGGSVTSVDVSGGTTGLTFSGGPVTNSGTITLAGTLGVANGGTGATTAANARANLGLTIGSQVQAWDADLDALAALSATNTIYYRSAANTWSAVTVGTALSFASGTLKLADTAVAPGSYGSATAVPNFTVDQQGRLTAAGTSAIPTLASGTYTPSLTSVANVSASATYPARYLRVGNKVMVWGKIELAAVASATLTRIALSLPIASNFANDWDADGTAAEATTGPSYPGAILADATNDRVELSMVSANTSGHSVYYSFGYEVM